MVYLLKVSKTELYIKPPKIAEWIIHLLVRSGNRQTLMGGLEEEYHYICSENGKFHANLWYIGQIFNPLINFIRSHTLWSGSLIL